MNEYNFNSMYGAPQMTPYQNDYSMNNARMSKIATNKLYVSSIQEVYGRYVPAGGDFIFVDANEPVIYQKIVDLQGKPEIKIFDIVPRKENKVDFVSRDEFEAIHKDIEELKEYLPKISSPGGKNESIK